jgi:hypothetical protein
MTVQKQKLIGELPADQIAEWKKKYGSVFGIKVEDHICYLRKPDRKILGAASVAAKINPLKFNEVILNNCFLGGSEAIKTDDELFLGASSVLADIIQVKEGELVNF